MFNSKTQISELFSEGPDFFAYMGIGAAKSTDDIYMVLSDNDDGTISLKIVYKLNESFSTATVIEKFICVDDRVICKEYSEGSSGAISVYAIVRAIIAKVEHIITMLQLSDQRIDSFAQALKIVSFVCQIEKEIINYYDKKGKN